MKNFRLKFFPISKVHLMILILFAAAFCTGSLLGKTTGQLLPDFGSVSASSENTSWGLSFQEKGKRPIGNASIEELKKYNAYYAADTEEKIIYLTFDCGYENGNMPKILEALKKHQVSAAFFVVGNFISDHPDLLRRNDPGRPHHWKSYHDPPGYVFHFIHARIPKRTSGCRKTLPISHRILYAKILPASKRNLQSCQSFHGKRTGV